MKKAALPVLLCLACSQAYCQERQASATIRGIAEELAAGESGEESSTAYLDRLYELADNPVNINSGDQDELARLFFLTDFQVKALADYTSTSGMIVSVKELPLIPGFDMNTAEMMLPFISLSQPQSTGSDPHFLKQKSVTSLSLRPESYDSSSCGGPWKILSRYTFTTGTLSGGFTAEKDAGEKFFTPGTCKPDFFSANITYTGKGLIRKLIIGDFSARFGQGTNISTTTTPGLSLTMQGYMSASNEIKGYTSAEENNFFRGTALLLSRGDASLAVFWSANRTDATTDTSGEYPGGYITGLYRSGLHNTVPLLSKKDAVSETMFGMNGMYNFNRLKCGLTFSHERFSLPFVNSKGNPSELVDFTGPYNSLLSGWYNLMLNRLLFYGELSADNKLHSAVVQGLSLRPADRLTLNLRYRRFSPGYTCFHGNGPGATPESSITGSFTIEAAKHLFFSGGCMRQKLLWLRYATSSPAGSVKRELRISYLPSARISAEGLYGIRITTDDNSQEQKIPGLTDIVTESARLTFKYELSDKLSFSTRMDRVRCRQPLSRGYLMLQDISYRAARLPLSLWLRYCVFSTGSWDSRIYTWENDLLYTFTVPALSGRGSRFYIMAGWKINDKADLRVKYGLLSKIEEPGGSGNTNELKIQLRILIW